MESIWAAATTNTATSRRQNRAGKRKMTALAASLPALDTKTGRRTQTSHEQPERHLLCTCGRQFHDIRPDTGGHTALFPLAGLCACCGSSYLCTKAGRAACVFNIGDEKTITLSTGEKITLVILGFFHDTYYDSEYDEDTSYTITFGMKNCLATRYQMNASNTNVGGWESSKMRTSVMPTLLSQLPADLQSVIKSVYKKTSAGNKSTTITTTNDKLFLLSEVEVNGTTATTYADEGEQYAYFKRNGGYVQYGNDGYYPNGIKALSNGDGASCYWWLHSPYVTGSYYFRCVYGGGSVGYFSASRSDGVSFGF